MTVYPADVTHTSRCALNVGVPDGVLMGVLVGVLGGLCALASCTKHPAGARARAAPESLANASRPALPPLLLANSEPACANADWKPKIATIVTLGDGVDNLRFDADDQQVIFLYDGRIVSMARADLSEHVLFERFAGIPGVARLQGGVAYWTERGRFQTPVGAVRARYPGSSAATTLAFGLESPESFVVRGDQLRWLDWKDGGVYRPDGKGGKGIRVADAGIGLGHMATGFPRLVADRHHLYFSRVYEGVRHEGNGIVRTDWNGHDELMLAPGQHHVEILGIGEDHVFWEAEKQIRRVAKTGGDVVVMAETSFPTALHVHRDYLYFIDNHIFAKERGYSLVRIPTTGGALETLFTSPRTSYVLQHNGDSLYWIEHGHIEGECRKESRHWYSKGENPVRHNGVSEVCDGPGGRLLSMRLPGC